MIKHVKLKNSNSEAEDNLNRKGFKKFILNTYLYIMGVHKILYRQLYHKSASKS